MTEFLTTTTVNFDFGTEKDFELNETLDFDYEEDAKKRIKLPKCCAKDMLYDVYSKSCMPNEFTDYDSAFNNNYQVHFYDGELVCPRVLVDYTIAASNAHYDGTNLVVSYWILHASHLIYISPISIKKLILLIALIVYFICIWFPEKTT